MFRFVSTVPYPIDLVVGLDPYFPIFVWLLNGPGRVSPEAIFPFYPDLVFVFLCQKPPITIPQPI